MPERIPFRRLYRQYEVLADPGHTKYREDGFAVRELPGALFTIAIDGVSGLYTGSPTLVKGLSGGEAVARLVEGVFSRLYDSSEPLVDVMRRANQEVAVMIREAGFPDDPAVMPGATFAAAKVMESEVEIVTAGDCFALWRTEVDLDSGTGPLYTQFYGSRNQVQAHDRVLDAGHEATMRQILRDMQQFQHDPKENYVINGANSFISVLPDNAELHRKVRAGELLTLEELPESWVEQYIRPKMRKIEFSLDGPVAVARRRNANNPGVLEGYGLLNGDPRLEECWQTLTIPRAFRTHLVLCSDGMVTREVYMDLNPGAVAEFVFGHYLKGGLGVVRQAVEKYEDMHSTASYVSRAERVGVAVDLRR